MFIIEQKEALQDSNISTKNAFILVFIFTALFSICLLVIRYIFKRQTERRSLVGVNGDRIRIFNLNRLN